MMCGLTARGGGGGEGGTCDWLAILIIAYPISCMIAGWGWSLIAGHLWTIYLPAIGVITDLSACYPMMDHLAWDWCWEQIQARLLTGGDDTRVGTAWACRTAGCPLASTRDELNQLCSTLILLCATTMPPPQVLQCWVGVVKDPCRNSPAFVTACGLVSTLFLLAPLLVCSPVGIILFQHPLSPDLFLGAITTEQLAHLSSSFCGSSPTVCPVRCWLPPSARVW